MQINRDRDREQVHHIPDLIYMNTEEHSTPPHLVPVVSDDYSYDDYIASPIVSEGEPLGEYGSPVTHIPPEPPSHQSPQGSNPGRPIWERDKNILMRASLNKMLYALTCGHHQQHINAKQLYKNNQRLKYKQRKRKIREGGDSVLNKMSLEHKIPTVASLMKSPLDKYITLAKNYCVYEGTKNAFIVNWVHPLFLKARAEASKEDKTN